MASLSVAIAPLAGRANPQGGQVAAGQATIQGQGTKTVTVTQSSQNAIINWNTFNISAGELTQFIQPNANAIVLNRVTGNLGPSQIYGTITANGRVFLVNPDGILFGLGSRVDAAGFLASTNDIRNRDFMHGHYNFNIPGRLDASIVNLGRINATNGGFAALVAPGVRNAGVITADLGHVALASGNGFTLDFYGDKLITLQVDHGVANQVIDVATGQPLTSLVENQGKLRANGGTVALTAAAARTVVDSVINNTGVIEANTVGTRNGMIVLGAATSTRKLKNAPTQNVAVSGTLSAAGIKAGQKGGTVTITGESILLRGVTINASGPAGGGTILVGGDYHGGASLRANRPSGITLEPWSVPTATTVTGDNSVIFNASATVNGDGGRVAVWSTGATIFAGSILARGGPLGGNGGTVETSGHSLNIDDANVNAGAPNGQGGHWLLDPADFTIDASAAATINASLAQGNDVIVVTSAGVGGNGDLFVNSPITWSTNGALTLDAFHSVLVNANITSTGNSSILNVIYNDGGSGGNLLTGSNASITFAGASPLLTINGLPYTLIRTATDLQNLTCTSCALAKDINLGSIANFTPIGPFTGTFDGLGHVISNLTIQNLINTNDLGLFSRSSGMIRNVSITNGAITLGDFNQNVGLLVGINDGQIFNTSSSGQIIGGSNTGSGFPASWGGLIGSNSGTVNGSSSAASITAAVSPTGGSAEGIGGLIGSNTGTVSNAHATGSINGGVGSGGLIGDSFSGTITNSYATGNISSSFEAGGLIGSASNTTIMNSFAKGNVSSSIGLDIGGLIGLALGGTISNSFAGGAVTLTNGSENVGGLVGESNGANISNVYATGFVTVLSSGLDSISIGGLVGFGLGGSIANSYAAGSVSTGINSSSIGGLVGSTNGPIINSFATGNVTAGPQSFIVAGLEGSFDSAAVVNSFASGVVSAGPRSSNICVIKCGLNSGGANSIGDAIAPWDFVHTWYTGPNGLPLLQAFRPIPPVVLPVVPPASPNIFTISYNPNLLIPLSQIATASPTQSATNPLIQLPISPARPASAPATAPHDLPSGDSKALNELAGDYILDFDEHVAEAHFGSASTIPFRALGPALSIATNWRPLMQGDTKAGFVVTAGIVTDLGVDVLAEIIVASACAASVVCGITVAVVSVGTAWYINNQLQKSAF